MNKRQQDKKLAQILSRMAVRVEPFEGGTKEERVRRGQEDFGWWCQTYLPHYFETGLAPFHRELVGLTEVKGQQVAVAAPRGHGKSTLISLARVLWWVVYRLRRFVVLVGCEADGAVLATAMIRHELEENERLRADFGDLTAREGGCWSEGHFRTAHGVMVLARGRGQKVRGLKNGAFRPDALILDDPEDDEQAASPQRVTKLLRWLKRSVRPALRRGGEWSLFWVGTVLTKRSALAQILGNQDGEYGGWRTARYAALKADGSALAPELHSAEALRLLKVEIGSPAFNAEYQNEPQDDEGPFRDEWLRTYDPAALAGELQRGETIAACDPSLYAGETSDYKVWLVGTRHPETADIYLRAAWLRRETLGAMVAAGYVLHRQWACTRMGIESTLLNRMITEELNAAAGVEGYHLPVVGIVNQLQKELRIVSLSPLHERGKIWYPVGWPGDFAVLKEQMQAWPSRVVHDDGPDCLEMVVRLLGREAQPYKSRRSGSRRTPLGFNR